MKVLRDNKESLLAVLEAFVYDPLINWRLMQTDADRPGDSDGMLAQVRKSICILTCDLVESDREIDSDAARLVRAAVYGQGPNRRVRADESEIFRGRIRR